MLKLKLTQKLIILLHKFYCHQQNPTKAVPKVSNLKQDARYLFNNNGLQIVYII